MKKYIFFVICSFAVGVAGSVVWAASSTQREMVALDKIYIVALAATNQGDREMSEKSMKMLATQWQSFKKKNLRAFNRDKKAGADFAAIGKMIDTAARIVKQNGNLNDAHESLEGVRITLMHLRKRNSIDYYIDHLTKFHEPMETAVLLAKSKTPETLSSEDIRMIKDLLVQSRQDWEMIKNADFDRILFSFSAEKDARRKEYIEAETKALHSLTQVLEGEDKAAIIKATMAIKPNFAKLFVLFGDFAAVK